MRGTAGLVAMVAITALGALLLPATERAGAANVGAITGGGAHTCALIGGGGLKCWGLNNAGQLGDGTTTQRSTPVDVSGLAGTGAAIVAGDQHTCARTTTGGMQCWGDNYYGELGDGTNTNSASPVDVSGLTTGVAAIGAGTSHTCAVTSSGGAKCWGANSTGQLGDGSSTNRSTPADVYGLTSGVAAIGGGGLHTCVLTTGGGVKCWGFNLYGQLGDGTTTSSLTPVNVSGLTSGVAAIAVGTLHACALMTSGAVKCWGSNTYGQLGDGTTADGSTPVTVSGLSGGVTAITAGFAHTCARTNLGAVKCWGHNGYGSLGDGTTTDRSTPVNVSGLGSGIMAIGAGAFHSCAVATTAQVLCWGSNALGKQGNGGTADNLTPAEVTGLGAKSCPDLDGDTICNDVDADIDGDLCPNVKELDSDPTQGGQRDPYNPWDYFNPTLDGINRTDDVGIVVMHYGHDDNGDPMYSARYDRTPLPGGHRWQFGPPDGSIRTADIAAAIRSYGHDCS